MRITHVVNNRRLKIERVRKATSDRITEKSPRSTEFTLNDLPNLTRIVKKFYNPERCNGAQLAWMVSQVYTNLKYIPTKLLIHDGVISRGNHPVCLVEGTDLLIDLVGDYVTYTDPDILQKDIVPWIYSKYNESSMYLSQNHVPFSTEWLESEICESDIVAMSEEGCVAGLRSIII